jgi:DNA-binding NtrC family response regulator
MTAVAHKGALEESLVARSPAMRALRDDLLRLCEVRTPVLLQGESGSGKDLAAYWIHALGPRRDAPFIKVHCPSIPADLLESELFGHERGAFTDARATKLGKVELAQGGTLYFDQVDDLDLTLQAKLLRVVEERRFERLGGTRTIEVDVRFLSSANVDLRAAVAQGRFREDLYHRLGVVPLRVPPLRERREDLQPLAESFLARERAQGTTGATAFAPEAEAALLAYAWPGNVRELRSAVERAALYTRSGPIERGALPPHVLEAPSSLWAGRERPPSLRDVEQAYILHVLETTAGNQTQAAAILGISRKALWEKRRRFGFP